MTSYRAQVYRLILSLAAVYNLGFGLWAAAWPFAFFDSFAMEPPRYPSIWRCLGMVVGLYGLAYGYSALHLDRARPLVALGLLGKVLGPVGWYLAVREAEFPLRTFTLILFNDLVWWLPFSLFLLEGTRVGERLRASAPCACAALNALAALALALCLRPGTEAGGDAVTRAAYIQEHAIVWRAGWGLWTAAALSLCAFYTWWGARLEHPGLGLVAFAVALVGLASDLFAESLYIAWLPEDLERISSLGSLLTGGVANGLYTTSGAVLTLGTSRLSRGMKTWAWAAWGSGYALSASAALQNVTLMVASTALLMALFCPLAFVLGRKLR